MHFRILEIFVTKVTVFITICLIVNLLFPTENFEIKEYNIMLLLLVCISLVIGFKFINVFYLNYV